MLIEWSRNSTAQGRSVVQPVQMSSDCVTSRVVRRRHSRDRIGQLCIEERHERTNFFDRPIQTEYSLELTDIGHASRLHASHDACYMMNTASSVGLRTPPSGPVPAFGPRVCSADQPPTHFWALFARRPRCTFPQRCMRPTQTSQRPGDQLQPRSLQAGIKARDPSGSISSRHLVCSTCVVLIPQDEAPILGPRSAGILRPARLRYAKPSVRQL